MSPGMFAGCWELYQGWSRTLTSMACGPWSLLASQCEAEGRSAPFRVASALRETDDVMMRGCWIGVYPGLTNEMRAYVASEIRAFVTTAGRC